MNEKNQCNCDCHYANSNVGLSCSSCLRRHYPGIDEPGDEAPIAYSSDWPRCMFCERPSLDGHLTCGNATCSEGAARDLQR